MTTRESLSDLAPYRDSTAPEKNLEFLSEEAGAQLLHQSGVTRAGTTEIQPDDKELKDASREVAGHALTLRLLGNYLALAENGDIRKRSEVRFEDADREYITNPADSEKAYGHAFKVMRAYENWFSGEGKSGKRLVAVLRLLGLFDRPADVGCIAALRKPPAISGLTDVLVDQGKAQWNLTLSRLAECGLISLTNNQALDAHPLIRDYFAKQLREQQPKVWHAGHKRLYEYLTTNTKDKIKPTLEDLQPLYQAVAHGCQAGMFQRVCKEVYDKRILRREQHYSWHHLGAYGVDLGALAWFFEKTWFQITPNISEITQGWLLHEAAYCLKSLGRHAEALEPMQSGIKISINNKYWADAARVSCNLSELELTLGNVANALVEAEQGVSFANINGHKFEQMVTHTNLAYALDIAGRFTEALNSFKEAEDIQSKYQPEYPQLYSVGGIRYCNLLLVGAEKIAWRYYMKSQYEISITEDILAALGNIDEVERRTAQTLTLKEKFNLPLLDVALCHHVLGQAALCRAMLNKSLAERDKFHQTAHKELETAVEAFRHAVVLQYLPHGLFSRACLRFMEGDKEGAKADMDEAWEIAERGPMRLYMADIHLYRARIFRDREALTQARTLIEQCGYWRRKEELEDAESEAKIW